MTQPEKSEKKQRRIFLWIPYVGIRPDRCSFELDATNPLNATLLYRERYDSELDEAIIARTTNMAGTMLKGLDPTVKTEIIREDDGVTLKASGPVQILGGLMLSELMTQAFETNPEKSFWRFVESAQNMLSSTHLPIRKMYEDFAGQPLHGDHSGIGGLGPMVKIECSKCGIKLEIPEAYAAHNPPMHCPNAECKHIGTVKEGKF